MVTEAIFTDYDIDGDEDLIVVGEWMPPTFFSNTNGVFKKSTVLDGKLNGLWQTIAPFDMDKDGDMDYVLGNWGLNSKYKASKEYPMLMYYGDYYTLNTLDELTAQLPSLKKKFNTYNSFAGKTIEEVFDRSTLKKLEKLKVHELASGYLQNTEGAYTFIPFKEVLQGEDFGINLSNKQVSKMDVLNFKNKEYLIITIHNGSVEVYEILK